MDNMNHLLFDFLDKHADMYEGKDAINPELYDLYKVKRGLRDKNGNGVVAGLTTISTIEAFDISGDQKVPCDGRLYYRGYDVRELVSGTVREKRFGFEPEITAKISKKRIRIHEVPISYHPRTTKEGKKIGFKDGLRAIYCIWRYR